MHPVAGRVHLLNTHGSYVYLNGQHALLYGLQILAAVFVAGAAGIEVFGRRRESR